MSPGFSTTGGSPSATMMTSALRAAATAAAMSVALISVVPGTYDTRSAPNCVRSAVSRLGTDFGYIAVSVPCHVYVQPPCCAGSDVAPGPGDEDCVLAREGKHARSFFTSVTASSAARRLTAANAARSGVGEPDRVRARILEQAEVHLEREDAPHGFVDARFADVARMDEREHIVDEERVVWHHAHVDAGVDRHAHGVAPRARDVRHGDEAIDVLPIRVDHALEAELRAQQIGEELVAGVHGDAVDLAGIGHDRAHARIDRGLEWRQEQLAQLSLGHPRRRAIPSAQRHAVADEVLAGGGDEHDANPRAPCGFALGPRQHRHRPASQQRIRGCDRTRLLGFNGLAAEHRREVDVLAEGLEEARPERLPPEVEHRREIPGDAARRASRMP